jgi:hypothetical protein
MLHPPDVSTRHDHALAVDFQQMVPGLAPARRHDGPDSAVVRHPAQFGPIPNLDLLAEARV